MSGDAENSAKERRHVPVPTGGQPLEVQRQRAVAVGAGAVGVLALGALAVGAAAVGTMVIGKLAIGKLRLGRARLRSGHVNELRIARLMIAELRIERGWGGGTCLNPASTQADNDAAVALSSGRLSRSGP